MSEAIELTEAKLRVLKVPELKDLLSKRGLTITGKKEELVARIIAFEQNKQRNSISIEEANETADHVSDLKSSIKPSHVPTNNVITNDVHSTAKEHHSPNDDDFRLDDIASPGLDENYDWDLSISDILGKEGDLDFVSLSPKSAAADSKDTSKKIESKKDNDSKDKNQISDKSTSESQSSVPVSKADTEESATSTAESGELVPQEEFVVTASGFRCKKITFDDNPVKAAVLLTEEEKRRKREQKFGPISKDSEKPAQRNPGRSTSYHSQDASRGRSFSSRNVRSQPRPKLSAEDKEKLKRRAEKFGLQPRGESSSINNKTNGKKSTSVDPIEEEKRRRRAEKFGTGNVQKRKVEGDKEEVTVKKPKV
ncbi:3960_t:CDS:2 [Paraglomus occultum]|uniref:3960_t:CDS:1 n=1 Tax=Paraglomus occultum TaxID=144539 RepID=A0A9N9CBD4_9GLOM|nr:3960_t:CDS:2 [Paraglomus occultum]